MCENRNIHVILWELYVINVEMQMEIFLYKKKTLKFKIALLPKFIKYEIGFEYLLDSFF